MKKIILFTYALLLLNSNALFPQVSINSTGTPPDNSAMLDISSQNRGFLLPRMTTNQLKMIVNPSTGLMVFTLDSLDLYIFLGDYWISILNCYNRDTISPIWACGDSITIDHLISGGVAPVNKTVAYGTVTNIPGEPTKCWITQNLGSDHQSTAVDDATEASAGWYWQFNRRQGYKFDGTLIPPIPWISNIDENSDWMPANDPCTIEFNSAWRIPTFTEWNNVDNAGNWTTWNNPWNSDLKMHAAGYIGYTNGSLYFRGTYGDYWSSIQNTSTSGNYLFFYPSACLMVSDTKAQGFPIRCVRE